MDPVKLFYSYAHEDKLLRDELGKHLRSLRLDGTCIDWYDADIRPGDKWDAEIKDKLGAADFILLLLSADFLNSDYSLSVELTVAIERQERKEAKIIPILLRYVDVGKPLSDFQGLPTGFVPVTAWPNQDAAFYDIAKSLRREFELFRAERAAPAPPAVVPPVSAAPVAPPAVASPASAAPVAPPTVQAAAPPPASPAPGLPPGVPLSETVEKNRVLAEASRVGVLSLGKLMASDKIKCFVAEEAVTLVAVDDALAVLFDYKNVHDALHRLQFDCYNYLFQEKRKPEEQIDWRILVKPAEQLSDILADLREAASAPSLADEDFSWLDDLTAGQASLRAASDDLSLPPLIEAARIMKTILEMRPSMFDTKLCAAARTLPLNDLRVALGTILGKLSPASVASEMGTRFRAGVQALPALEAGLQALTAEHNSWQGIATRLWSINALLDDDLEALRRSWDWLRCRLEKICGGNSSPWAIALLQEVAKLDGLLKEPTPVDPNEKRKWRARVLQSYESCSSGGETRFFQVDVSLLNLCTQLRDMHTALAAILQDLP